MERTPPQPVRYELVNVHELPSIDLTRSVKSLVFTARGLQRFNAVMGKLNRPLSILYCGSIPAEFAMLIVPASIGKWLALVKVICQLPMILQGIAALRADIVRCLLYTYEFWFLTVTNVINCVVLVLYFGDARAMIVLLFGLGSQLSVCVDANLQAQQLLGTSLIVIFDLVCLLISVALQLTPETNSLVLVKYNGHTMSNNDVVLSTLSIMLIYMIRTVYRKHQRAKRQPGKSSRIQCVIYRCRVKFQAEPLLTAPIGPTLLESSSEVRSVAAVMTKQQLQLVRRDLRFVENDVISFRIASFFDEPAAVASEHHQWKARALYTIGLCSLALNVTPFILKKYPFQSTVSVTLYCCALTYAFCFVGAFVASFNRKLLRELVFSFDFCFLSAQFTAVHLCICDLFLWDSRCFSVLYIWLAFHWVLTLDALTPTSRARLGLQIRFVIPIVALIVLAITRLLLDLIVVVPNRPTHDHVLWRLRILNHTIEFRVVPFILNRAWSVALWCLRILWRLWTSDENGQILIQGNVEFVVNRKALQIHNSKQASSTVQVPLANKLARWTHVRVNPNIPVPLQSQSEAET